MKRLLFRRIIAISCGVATALSVSTCYAQPAAREHIEPVNLDPNGMSPDELVKAGEKDWFGQPQDIDRAVSLFQQAADQGNANGEWDLGRCYDWGRGVVANKDQAIKWYRKAAKQGHSQARQELRSLFVSGKLNPVYVNGDGQWWQDLADEAEKEKQEFNRRSVDAKNGDADAMVQVGVDYLTGVGTPKNRTNAVSEFRRSAELGQAEAGCFSGILSGYDDRWSKPSEWEQAGQRCISAANQGYADSQYIVSFMYRFGMGVPQDANQAVQWALKSADQGNARAQVFVGYAYDTGFGVPKDETQSIAWYRKAAVAGDPPAMGYLALLAQLARVPSSKGQFSDPIRDPETEEKYRNISHEHEPDADRNLISNLFSSNFPHSRNVTHANYFHAID